MCSMPIAPLHVLEHTVLVLHVELPLQRCPHAGRSVDCARKVASGIELCLPCALTACGGSRGGGVEEEHVVVEVQGPVAPAQLCGDNV